MTIFVFTEEESCKVTVDAIAVALGFREEIICSHFNGKYDLKKKIRNRLLGLQRVATGVVILIDQDHQDCIRVKNEIIDICADAFPDGMLKIRIVCRELESWFLGDSLALIRSYENHNLERSLRKSIYRRPDEIMRPKEQLKAITKGDYTQIAGSRLIAPHLALDGTNRSTSFNIFLNTLRTFLNL